MADEFQLGSGNWWDAPRSRFDTGSTPPASSALHGGTDQSSAADNPNMQMMELGLSSQGMDWNEALFRDEKGENSSFRSILQEDLLSSNISNFQEPETAASASSQEHWAHNSSAHDLKQMNRGFSMDQQQFSSQACSNDSSLTTSFPLDSAATAYSLLLPPENQPAFSCPSSSAAGLIPTWNNNFHQFLRSSPVEEPPRSPPSLHFTYNSPFWTASAPAADARSSFFTCKQTQIPASAPSFTEKPKSRDSSTAKKKSSTETSSNNNKRPRKETPSSSAFKVRKEKVGDRITALQQLVSPFGKTDTASALSEAIEYIKFLHEQISVLSTPYMNIGDPVNHQQNSDYPKDPAGGPHQDLRSRGLCLVPVSSTFPVTHETVVDFWTPTFGGSFR